MINPVRVFQSAVRHCDMPILRIDVLNVTQNARNKVLRSAVDVGHVVERGILYSYVVLRIKLINIAKNAVAE